MRCLLRAMLLLPAAAAAQTDGLYRNDVAISFRQSSAVIDEHFDNNGARLGDLIARLHRIAADTTLSILSIEISGMAFASGFATGANLTWDENSKKAKINIATNGTVKTEYPFEWSSFNATSVAVNNPNDGYLYFIPQTYGADENTYISVSYTIKGVQQTAMRQLEAGEFKGGHAYRFNITLNVSAIEFTVEKEIEAWDEVSAKEVTIE